MGYTPILHLKLITSVVIYFYKMEWPIIHHLGRSNRKFAGFNKTSLTTSGDSTRLLPVYVPLVHVRALPVSYLHDYLVLCLSNIDVMEIRQCLSPPLHVVVPFRTVITCSYAREEPWAAVVVLCYLSMVLFIFAGFFLGLNSLK